VWAPDLVWTIGITEKILAPPGTRTQRSTARSAVIIPTTLARLVVTLPHLTPSLYFPKKRCSLYIRWGLTFVGLCIVRIFQYTGCGAGDDLF
jgi:hypothetical protein